MRRLAYASPHLLSLALAAALGAGGCMNPTSPGNTGGDDPWDLAGPTNTDGSEPKDLAAAKPDLAGGVDGGGTTDDLAMPIDVTPPMITITQPVPGTVVAGMIQVSAKILDDTTLDESSVTALFAHDSKYEFQLRREKAGSDVFIGAFDAAQLPPEMILPVLSVRAADKAGNKSEMAEEIAIDIVAPEISLDPPLVHAKQPAAVGMDSCSHPFDPVGPDAANDGDKVYQVMTLRAQIEDAASVAPGSDWRWISFVDRTSVRMYVSPVALGDLLYDSNGDGICDDVNPALRPTHDLASEPGKAISVPLGAIPPAGAADFSPAPGDAVCPNGIGLLGAVPPRPLCGGAVTIVKGYYLKNGEPSIYAPLPSFQPPAYGCTGAQFDGANFGMTEGPTCVAVVASDNVGNRTISPPMRICIDRGGGKCAGWPPASLPACGKCQPGVKSNLWKHGDSVPLPYEGVTVWQMQ